MVSEPPPYQHRLPLSVLVTIRAGRLDRQSIRHPRFVVERRSALKRHCPKLTVLRAAANSCVAFQSASLGLFGVCLLSVADIVPQQRRGQPSFRVSFGWVRCGRPSLTQGSLLSTLKQSPESRRYGCDPDVVSGDRAGQQQDPPLSNPGTDAVDKRGGMARRVEPE